MKNSILQISQSEKVLMENETKSLRFVVTTKRIIVEDKVVSVSIYLKNIGAVELVKRGKSAGFKFVSSKGETMFNDLEDNILCFMPKQDAAAFEAVINDAIIFNSMQ